MRKLVTLSCIAFFTAAAVPAGAAQPTAGTQNGKANTEEKKICKQLPSTGSRLPNKACLTAKQWKQVEEDVSR